MYDFQIKNLSFIILWLLIVTSGLSIFLGAMSAKRHKPRWTRAFWINMALMVSLASLAIYLWTSSWWVAIGPVIPAFIFVLIYINLRRVKD